MSHTPNPHRTARGSTLVLAFGLALALWMTLAATAWAGCGGQGARAALADEETADKFSAAAQLCAQPASASTSLAGLPHVAVRERAPAEPLAQPAMILFKAPPQQFPMDTRRESRVEPWPAGSAGAAGPVSRDAARRAIALAPQIDEVAEAYRIDPLLLHAIAHVESRHNPAAVSHAGARGLMQVMPQTGRRFGAASGQLFDPRVSLEVSAAYLKTLQARFGNDLPIVIAAYNAGEGAVEKYGRSIPPYAETRDYVKRVMAHYRLLAGARSARTAAR